MILACYAQFFLIHPLSLRLLMMVLLAEAIGRTKQSNGGGGVKQWKYDKGDGSGGGGEVRTVILVHGSQCNYVVVLVVGGH